MHNLTFLNHASFYVESESSILVIDPWLEGRAFNQGWALLDQTTKNDSFIERLIEKNKKIFIWITHEHSDHFNVPLILKIKSKELKVEFIYQSTKDRRVENFLEKNNFKVLSAEDDKTIHLDKDMSINVWSFGGGDAFGLIKIGNKTILNVNDCNLSNEERIYYVKNKISHFSKKLDFLFIQFGYANWIGNEENTILREQSASEKISRIVHCEEILAPRCIFPFASFCFFCHEENFYINDMQNSPEKLRNSDQLKAIQKKIFFLKPYDEIKLDPLELERYHQISLQAEQHYNALFKSKKIEVFNDEINEPLESINNKLRIFAKKINRNFLYFPAILELFGLLERPRIFLTDISQAVELSYFFNLKSSNKWDISMHSKNLDFVLANEYGFDATHVNGRFRVNTSKSLNKFRNFFFFQDLMRNGLGIGNPLFSINTLSQMLFNKASKKRKKIF